MTSITAAHVAIGDKAFETARKDGTVTKRKTEDLTDKELDEVKGGVALLLPAVQQAREAALRAGGDSTTTASPPALPIFTCPDDQHR